MIARLHDGGLEVVLDVVYNHTAEGNERGPDFVVQGHRQPIYYRLLPDNRAITSTTPEPAIRSISAIRA